MEITLASAALIPVVVAFAAAIKRAGVASRWMGIISILLGIAVVWIADLSAGVQWLDGIVVGLSASGLYSGSKAVIK